MWVYVQRQQLTAFDSDCSSLALSVMNREDERFCSDAFKSFLTLLIGVQSLDFPIAPSNSEDFVWVLNYRSARIQWSRALVSVTRACCSFARNDRMLSTSSQWGCSTAKNELWNGFNEIISLKSNFFLELDNFFELDNVNSIWRLLILGGARISNRKFGIFNEDSL